MPLTSARARDLVQVLVEYYAGIGAYADRGVVLVDLPGSDPPLEIAFSTLYQAPNRFRFEFEVPHPHPTLRHLTTRYVVGGDGKTAYSLTRFPEAPAELREHRTLELALAGATGMSCGAAHTIARLLLHEVRGFALSDLEDLKVAGEILAGGAACHRVTGTHPRAGDHELCIGRDDGLLHKLSKRSANLPVVDLRRSIEVDATIDPQRFRIDQVQEDSRWPG